MRQEVRMKIEDFFSAAINNIPKPDLEKAFAPHLKSFKTPVGLDEHFFRSAFVNIRVTYGQFDLSQRLNDSYASAKEDNKNNSLHKTILIDLDEWGNAPEEVVRYCKQCNELEEARRALQTAASLALNETSVQKALQRLPELERFL